MTARRIAQVFVLSVFVFAVGFVGWALLQMRSHDALLAELRDEGVEVDGQVVSKHKSDPSPGSSARVSHIIDVEHRYGGESFTNSYPVSSGEYRKLGIGDRIEVVILPDEPRVGQRAAVVRGEAGYSGFIPVDRD